MKNLVMMLVVLLALVACSREQSRPEQVGGKGGAALEPDAPQQGEDGESGRPAIGDAMPDFEAVYLDGKKFTVGDQKGKVVLLNLWATWCGPCRFEIPELIKLQNAHKSDRFDVIGVSVDDATEEKGKKEVADFVGEKKINYPIVLDPDGKLAEILRTSVIPTSVLVDRKGRVVWYHVGIVRADEPALQAALKAALGS